MRKINDVIVVNTINEDELIPLIHKWAEVNGSTCKIRLMLTSDGKKRTISSSEGLANSNYTKGYFAILYMIDCLNDSTIAYTSVSNRMWFSITIIDIEKFYLFINK